MEDAMLQNIYLLCFLDFTDLLSSSRVVGRKDLSTNRVMPLIVDEDLQGGNVVISISVSRCNNGSECEVMDVVSFV